MRALFRVLAPAATVVMTASLLASPSQADDFTLPPTSNPTPHAAVSKTEQAKAALQRAEALHAGRAKRTGAAAPRSYTLALRDLALLRSHLKGADAAAAAALVARPTYSVAEATPLCGTHVCIHYVTSSTDAVPAGDANANMVPDYVDSALATMEHVHTTYTGAGYRAPKPDGTAGGNALTDIYLKNIGPDGLYGYCTSDQPVVSGTFDYWAFCALDNDYSPAEFPTNTPQENFQVTAAHEYFHAVQFAYDMGEDAWMMEATATWAEDELYDSVNDNRQYLSAGQLGDPRTPLDTWSGTSVVQYGNWIFFRYLTEKYPTKVGGLPVLIKQIWAKADAAPGGPDKYSIQAVNAVLATKKSSVAKEFGMFSAKNRFARTFYSEGAQQSYPQAPIADSISLSRGQSTSWVKSKLNHQTSLALGAKPKRVPAGWKLKVQVDMANKVAGPVVMVDQVTTTGKHNIKYISLSKDGKGALTVPFTSAGTSQVVITLVNASTRYTCWQGTNYSCQGVSKDDGQPFAMRVLTTR